MDRRIQNVMSPDRLNEYWDKLATCYFQKREFLSILHKYNSCEQRYYELYRNGELVAGTVIYTLRLNLLTFSKLSVPFKMQVIGLPISVSTIPIIGDSSEFEYFINELLKIEKGLILGLNFSFDFYNGKVVNMRTLPTIVLKKKFQNMEEYTQSLRYNYRRRLNSIQKKFKNVRSIVTDCSTFTMDHYMLYLQIMGNTTTKLETLSLELFKNLPQNFILTTHYFNDTMLSWQICCKDNETLYFFFGGMNYQLRDAYHSYHNNLISILKESFKSNYQSIDFGQTAERAKISLGGELDERIMFLYHKNPMILFMLRLFRPIITYLGKPGPIRVFKAV